MNHSPELDFIEPSSTVLKENDIETKFSATFNQIAVGLAHTSLEGRFMMVNQKFCNITGYSSSEVLNLTFKDITHPDDLHENLEYTRKLLNGEIQNFSMEKRYIQKRGSVIWINLTASLVRTSKGEPNYFIAVMEDISKRKSVEIALQQMQLHLEKRVLERTAELEKTTLLLQNEIIERKYAELERNRFFSISQDAMMVYNSTGNGLRFNNAFTKILGYSEEELRSFPLRQIIHPDDQPELEAAHRELKETHLLKNFENRYIHKNGSIVHLSWNATLLPEQGLIYAIARDVTESKIQERAKIENQEKIVAASKMQSLGRMAAGVAHEINNPLTIVYGQAYRLKKMTDQGKLDPDVIRTAAEQIEQMSMRIVNITNGLRTFAREGSTDPFVFVSLQKILNETLSFCHNKMLTEGILVTVSDFPKNLEIHCRSVQISQVILNFLNNARDSIQGLEEKTIKISFESNQDEIGISVEDSGLGVKGENVSKLFEPFFTTKEVGKGTGLGLSVSKGIIKSHGGRIFYEPASPRGARFTFLLPKVQT